MNNGCFDLINSRFLDKRGQVVDRLDDPKWLDRFLVARGVPAEAAADPALKELLCDLRTLLRRVVAALSEGAEPSEADVAAMNSYLAAAPVCRRLVRDKDGYRLDMEAAAPGWAALQAGIVVGAADLLVRGERGRTKICPGCDWAFYDESKSRTKRWCESGECGNRDKVRRFRERHRTF